MNVDLVKAMAKDEILGLADAFRIDHEGKVTDELCESVARKLREE